MALEVERRFLVDPKRLPKLRKGNLQIQGYLNERVSTDTAQIRVRIEGKSATLTIKYRESDLIRQEFEFPIPKPEAEKLLKLTNKKISKVRHKMLVDGKKWEIDFFQGENFPLVIAEIELQSEKEVLSPPLWLTKEITANLNYTAMSLAFHPFQNWKKSELKFAGNKNQSPV